MGSADAFVRLSPQTEGNTERLHNKLGMVSNRIFGNTWISVTISAISYSTLEHHTPFIFKLISGHHFGSASPMNHVWCLFFLV